VPSLADLQAGVQRALTAGDAASLAAVLVGGGHPVHRLAIHRRHYLASLTTALLEKYPATVWLLGPDTVARAAGAFLRAHPPARPCIAEYGAEFPAFLAAYGGSALPPYTESFAELERAVAQVSIAVSEPSTDWADLVAVGGEALPRTALTLQTGVRLVHAGHAVDDLLKIYLAGTEHEQFTLDEGDVWIQVRGARGDVDLTRLDAPTFEFRSALLSGQALGDAAARALSRDVGFDAAAALRALVAEGLVTAVSTRAREDA
jgi:hypothetical protein